MVYWDKYSLISEQKNRNGMCFLPKLFIRRSDAGAVLLRFVYYRRSYVTE